MIEAYLKTNKKGPLNIPYGPVNPHLLVKMETSPANSPFFKNVQGLNSNPQTQSMTLEIHYKLKTFN